MPENRRQVSELGRVLLEELWEPEGAPPAGPCPDPETIGALIAGTLPADESVRVEEHVAACESCYEGYATAIAFLAEESRPHGEEEVPAEDGHVLPFERPSRPARSRGLRQALPWAAMIALAATTGWWLLVPPALPSANRLMAQFPPQELQHTRLALPDPMRGPGDVEIPDWDLEESTREAFQAGGSAFDLLLAAKRQNREEMEAFAAELADLVERQPTQSSTGSHLRRLTDDLRSGEAKTQDLAVRAQELARATEKIPFFHPPTFAFGRLIEAARIAADSGQAKFFTDRTFRSGLTTWPKKNPRRAELAQESLAALVTAWDARPQDLKAIGEAINSVQIDYGLSRVSAEIEMWKAPVPPPFKGLDGLRVLQPRLTALPGNLQGPQPRLAVKPHQAAAPPAP